MNNCPIHGSVLFFGECDGCYPNEDKKQYDLGNIADHLEVEIPAPKESVLEWKEWTLIEKRLPDKCVASVTGPAVFVETQVIHKGAYLALKEDYDKLKERVSIVGEDSLEINGNLLRTNKTLESHIAIAYNTLENISGNMNEEEPVSKGKAARAIEKIGTKPHTVVEVDCTSYDPGDGPVWTGTEENIPKHKGTLIVWEKGNES